MGRVAMSILTLCVSCLVATKYHSIFYSRTKLPEKHTALLIFGDSWLDVGNNNYFDSSPDFQANFPPYETTGRFPHGRIIPDFIAEFANLPPIPPYLDPRNKDEYTFGVNFASGGAGVLAETHQGWVIPFETQARYFKKVTNLLRNKLGSSDAKTLLSSAVYMFCIGSNDYHAPFDYSHSEFVGMIIGNFTSVIKDIYNIGARKFVFMNLPPLGCLPANRIIHSEGNDSCSQKLSALVTSHNQDLSKVLLQLEKQLEGFKFSLYDFNADLTQMINHPLKYDLKEGKSGCCGSGALRRQYSCGGKRGGVQFELCDNPNEHIFWDSYHLTESANNHLAISMWGTIRDLFQT